MREVGENARELYNNLATLDKSILDEDFEILDGVRNRAYAELVAAGLYQCTDFYDYLANMDLHNVVFDLTAILSTNGAQSDMNELKPNYSLSSQNILCLSLAIKMLNDPDVKVDVKHSLLNLTIFSTFGIAIPFQCFPYTDQDDEQIYHTAAYARLLSELFTLTESTDPTISDWAKVQLMGIKESVWRVSLFRGGKLDNELITVTDEEAEFFKLDHKDREIYTFKRRLKADFFGHKEELIENIPVLLVDFLRKMNSRTFNTSYIARGKLNILIVFLSEHPDLFSSEKFFKEINQVLEKVSR